MFTSMWSCQRLRAMDCSSRGLCACSCSEQQQLMSNLVVQIRMPNPVVPCAGQVAIKKIHSDGGGRHDMPVDDYMSQRAGCTTPCSTSICGLQRPLQQPAQIKCHRLLCGLSACCSWPGEGPQMHRRKLCSVSAGLQGVYQAVHS